MQKSLASLRPLSWYKLKVRAKGLMYKAFYGLFNPRVKIGRNFKVAGRLTIYGPGQVIIGDDVQCGMHATPCALDRDAILRIGNRVLLNGTRIGCVREIVIEDDCILADCRLTDSDFHSVDPAHRNDSDYIKTAPIHIGRNSWVTMNCIILKGVRIGENVTITPASVVIGDVPDNCIYGGNPAELIRHLD